MFLNHDRSTMKRKAEDAPYVRTLFPKEGTKTEER